MRVFILSGMYFTITELAQISYNMVENILRDISNFTVTQICRPNMLPCMMFRKYGIGTFAK